MWSRLLRWLKDPMGFLFWLIVALVALMGVLSIAGCATIDFPVVQQIAGPRVAVHTTRGISVQKYSAGVKNDVPLQAVARVIVWGREEARLGPGGLALDQRLTQFHPETVPVMAFYHEDLGNGELGRFLGLAWGKIYLDSYQTTPQILSFGLNNIVRPDGSYFQNWGFGGRSWDHPIPRADLREHTYHMSRKWLGGTNGIQAANGSLFHVRIRLVHSSQTVLDLPPASFVYLEAVQVASWGAAAVVVDYLQPTGDGFLLIQSSPPLTLGLRGRDLTGHQLVIGPPSRGAALY